MRFTGLKPPDRWFLRNAPAVGKLGRERPERNTDEAIGKQLTRRGRTVQPELENYELENSTVSPISSTGYTE